MDSKGIEPSDRPCLGSQRGRPEDGIGLGGHGSDGGAITPSAGPQLCVLSVGGCPHLPPAPPPSVSLWGWPRPLLEGQDVAAALASAPPFFLVPGPRAHLWSAQVQEAGMPGALALWPCFVIPCSARASCCCVALSKCPVAIPAHRLVRVGWAWAAPGHTDARWSPEPTWPGPVPVLQRKRPGARAGRGALRCLSRGSPLSACVFLAREGDGRARFLLSRRRCGGR